MYNLP